MSAKENFEKLNRWAKQAYEAHCRERNGLDLSGNKLWAWEQLPPELQKAWRAAACSVLVNASRSLDGLIMAGKMEQFPETNHA